MLIYLVTFSDRHFSFRQIIDIFHENLMLFFFMYKKEITRLSVTKAHRLWKGASYWETARDFFPIWPCSLENYQTSKSPFPVSITEKYTSKYINVFVLIFVGVCLLTADYSNFYWTLKFLAASPKNSSRFFLHYNF